MVVEDRKLLDPDFLPEEEKLREGVASILRVEVEGGCEVDNPEPEPSSSVLRPFRRSTKFPVSAAIILYCNNGDGQKDSNQARER
jgi:hypothetical protein